MYSYITEELPKVVFDNFKEIDSSKVSITGHSMGGHGALSLYLKNPGKYKSVSAFAPIANPLKAPWGEKAFKGYFGEQDWQSKGAEHDSTELLKKWSGGPLDILIDVVSILDFAGRLGADVSREPVTTPTSKASYYRRTSPLQRRKLARKMASMSGSSLTTTTATTQWRPSQMTMLITPRSICSNSSLLYSEDMGTC